MPAHAPLIKRGRGISARMLESGSKRDFAIVTLLVYAGLRRSECVNLKLDQVDLIAKEIRVIGKGDKQRLVYINDRIAAAIREYLKERNADSPYLFASRQCAKLSASRINQIFNQYSDTITPKTLRHFSAPTLWKMAIRSMR